MTTLEVTINPGVSVPVPAEALAYKMKAEIKAEWIRSINKHPAENFDLTGTQRSAKGLYGYHGLLAELVVQPLIVLGHNPRWVAVQSGFILNPDRNLFRDGDLQTKRLHPLILEAAGCTEGLVRGKTDYMLLTETLGNLMLQPIKENASKEEYISWIHNVFTGV
jgi:hypothetical protein